EERARSAERNRRRPLATNRPDRFGSGSEGEPGRDIRNARASRLSTECHAGPGTHRDGTGVRLCAQDSISVIHGREWKRAASAADYTTCAAFSEFRRAAGVSGGETSGLHGAGNHLNP